MDGDLNLYSLIAEFGLAALVIGACVYLARLFLPVFDKLATALSENLSAINATTRAILEILSRERRP